MRQLKGCQGNITRIYFRPKKDWSIGDLHNLTSSVSTIYNVFFIINNGNNSGVRRFLDNLHDRMQDANQVFPGLDAHLDNEDKLMIDHIEMGSPDGFSVKTTNNNTGNDTKEFLKGDIDAGSRINGGHVDFSFRDMMSKALTNARDIIKRLEREGKLADVRDNIDG